MRKIFLAALLLISIVLALHSSSVSHSFSGSFLPEILQQSVIDQYADTEQFQSQDSEFVYLPTLFGDVRTPELYQINNTDFDNYYGVYWQNNAASSYILEESGDPTFSSTIIVYNGNNSSWSVPSPGKAPSTFFYRVKARTADGRESTWSNIQAVSINPIYIGLHIRWDGVGYIRTDNPGDVGYHNMRYYDLLSAYDTARSYNQDWYDPDPFGWGLSEWYSYYSISTGYFLSSSVPPNPDWKWSHYDLLPYDISFQHGQIYNLDGRPFRVTGPHFGYSSFGLPMFFWKLVNTQRFLYWDGDPNWKQYVEEGDAILMYEAGNTRLLVHENIKRTYYYQGTKSPYTVQYIIYLTCSDSFSGGECGNPRPKYAIETATVAETYQSEWQRNRTPSK